MKKYMPSNDLASFRSAMYETFLLELDDFTMKTQKTFCCQYLHSLHFLAYFMVIFKRSKLYLMHYHILNYCASPSLIEIEMYSQCGICERYCDVCL